MLTILTSNTLTDCWPYKAIRFAFEAKLIDFNPDINIFSMQTFSEVCSISVNEDHIKEFTNTIYEKRYNNFVGINFILSLQIS